MSHFIRVQIFQIDFALILSASKHFRNISLSFYICRGQNEHFSINSVRKRGRVELSPKRPKVQSISPRRGGFPKLRVFSLKLRGGFYKIEGRLSLENPPSILEEKKSENPQRHGKNELLQATKVPVSAPNEFLLLSTSSLSSYFGTRVCIQHLTAEENFRQQICTTHHTTHVTPLLDITDINIIVVIINFVFPP